MKKAFSLLEIIFVIAVAAFLVSVAMPRLSNSLDKANLVKIKGDLALIREGLNSFKNKMLLSSDDSILESLEDDDSTLFSKILKYPIINNEEQKTTSWNKLSDSEYIVWVSNDTKVKFTYDSSNYTFECDFKDEKCKELTSSY